jgi:hypothetical protein
MSNFHQLQTFFRNHTKAAQNVINNHFLSSKREKASLIYHFITLNVFINAGVELRDEQNKLRPFCGSAACGLHKLFWSDEEMSLQGHFWAVGVLPGGQRANLRHTKKWRTRSRLLRLRNKIKSCVGGGSFLLGGGCEI